MKGDIFLGKRCGCRERFYGVGVRVGEVECGGFLWWGFVVEGRECKCFQGVSSISRKGVELIRLFLWVGEGCGSFRGGFCIEIVFGIFVFWFLGFDIGAEIQIYFFESDCKFWMKYLKMYIIVEGFGERQRVGRDCRGCERVF